jgi:hypothetical protein
LLNTPVICESAAKKSISRNLTNRPPKDRFFCAGICRFIL